MSRLSRITEVDSKEIDCIWRFVAAAKKQGIYTAILALRGERERFLRLGIVWLSLHDRPRGRLFFDETLQGGYKGPGPGALHSHESSYGESLSLWSGIRRRPPSSPNEDSCSSEDDDCDEAAHQTARKKFGCGSLRSTLDRRGDSVLECGRAWDGLLRAQAGVLLQIQRPCRCPQPQAGGWRRAGSPTNFAFYAETQRRFYAVCLLLTAIRSLAPAS